MYINFTKFDYEALNIHNYLELEERDKKYYKNILSDWFNLELNNIVNRKWDIDDIGFVEKTSDFVKLIKESEFSYTMGAYTSAIALIGISAEDLCRYFAILSGQNLDDLSQFSRIDKLFELQQYGIAFPEGSNLREPVNRVMLDITRSEEWQRTLRSYLGDSL